MKACVLFAACVLAGCSVHDTTDAENHYQYILDAVYNDIRVPAGFYKEDISHDTFYVTRHLRGADNSELSTNDYFEALEWDRVSTNEQQIDISETEIYWQFSHVGGEPTSVHRNRVLKLNVIDRSGVELNCDNCYQGKLNPMWESPSNIKLIIEYLWTFTLENNPFNSVLESYTNENPDVYFHTIVRAELVHSGTDECDTVNIYENQYTINKDSGIITKTTTLMNQLLTSRQTAAVAPAVCK